MAQATVAGSRIRERRLDLGIKQADLAARVGISPAYLNLIEHNRRRIGGRTLIEIARELEVDVTALSEGADDALVGELHDAVAAHPEIAAETNRLPEFAGRFPGLARVMLAQHRRIDALRGLVDSLSDRLEHDPFLAESLHEVLSAATAISSTAEILTGATEGEIEPLRRRRFLRNILEDGRRMAGTARRLANYLDGSGAEELQPASAPLDEMLRLLETAGWSFPRIEAEGAAAVDPVAAELAHGASTQVRAMLAAYLRLYARDAATLPAPRLAEAVAAVGPDPQALAALLGVGLPVLMHRLVVAAPEGVPPTGLTVVDMSGAILYRRQLPGFPVPHFGQGCPRQPLYRALTQPAVPVAAQLRISGGDGFLAFAATRLDGQERFDRPPLVRSYQLVMPADQAPRALAERVESVVGPPVEVGANCRICAVRNCDARREPSLLKGIG